jgi:hypothetical protein
MRTLTIGAALLLASAAPATAADPALQFKREGIALMKQLDAAGREIQDRVDRLQTLSRDEDVSRTTHYFHLERIRDTINMSVRPAILRLTAIQTELPEWKQPVVSDLLAAAQQLATHTTAAFDDKRQRVVLPTLNADYQRRLSELSAQATAMVTRADTAATYADARLRAAAAGVAAF